MEFSVKRLNSRISDFFLKDISLKISDTDYYVILGPTGSGKSSFLKSLLGLYKIESGDIILNGKEISAYPVEKRGIGYLPQNYALFPHLNVYDNIKYGTVYIKDKKEIQKRIKNIIELLKIKHLLDRDVKTLSGGEKQKTALARCLAVNPHIMLLDEPFSAIDEGSKRILWFEIKKIIKKIGIPVIHITHNLDEAYSLAEKIGVMIKGKLVQTGTKKEIFENPNCIEIAKLLNYRNIFHGEVIDQINGTAVVKTENFILKLKTGISKENKITFCIKQQDIKIIRLGDPVKPELQENIYEGIIVSEIFYPNNATIFFKIENSSNDYDFEISFPPYIYKRYDLHIGKKIQTAVWQPSIITFF